MIDRNLQGPLLHGRSFDEQPVSQIDGLCMGPRVASGWATSTDGVQLDPKFPIAVEIDNPKPTSETGPYELTCEHDGHPGWSFRYYPFGQCAPESRLTMVRDAFRLAYQVCRSAELELFYWGGQSEYYRKKYWRLRTAKGEEGTSTTLGWWFGSETAPDFNERFSRVEQVVTWWSYCFSHGFHPWHQPVYVRCKAHDDSKLARHSPINTITLYKSWFEDYDYNSRAAIVLHEMGHSSQKVGEKIWDRRNPVCSGNGGGSKKCYSEAKLASDARFRGDDCRLLAVSFELGIPGAYKDMMKNIDNYVCWMWNRYWDRGRCLFKLA